MSDKENRLKTYLNVHNSADASFIQKRRIVRFMEARTHLQACIKQYNDEADLGGHDEFRTKFGNISHSVTNKVSDFFDLIVPIFVGGVAVFIGQFPEHSKLFKHLIGG